MQEIHTDAVAESVAPLAQGIVHGDTVYVSGQVPRTPDGELVTGDIGAQTAQTLDNVEAILEAAGTSMECVVKATVFLTDMSDFAGFNEAYRERFGDSFPARSAIGVEALALDEIDVEIEVIAAL